MALLTIEAGNVANTFSNTEVNLIVITEDKLVNILGIHVGRMRKSKEWLASLSFSITLLLVLLTSKFEAKWGLSGEQWQMAFIFLFIGSLIYLGYSIYNCLKHNVTVEVIVQDIKNVQQTQS